MPGSPTIQALRTRSSLDLTLIAEKALYATP
ncbi:hypothetical protein M2432_003286 [Mycobacterium sp. OTB74]|nr:hypothetical protein [Mycobacterium sp. OTB74]